MPYIDPKPKNNIILTQTESLMLDGRPKNPKHARNKNVLIIGGSGSGKTRFWLKPNLMQLHSSYCITDPKGTVLIECGKLLQRNRYRIKVLNTIDFKKSLHYNPFVYIRSEKDILKFTTALIANTKGEDAKSGEDFWQKSEVLLYCALIGFIHFEAPEEEQNMNSLVEMINAMEVHEEDENFRNAVDYMFEQLEQKNPQHFAVRQYAKYKLAAGLVNSNGLLNQKPIFYWQSKHLRHKWTDTILAAITPGKDKAMNEITYTLVGDYYLPKLTLTEPPNAPHLGRYGTMHKEYLRREKPALYATLLLTERLYPLCREIDEAAAHRLTTIGDREMAHEIILAELVYC